MKVTRAVVAIIVLVAIAWLLRSAWSDDLAGERDAPVSDVVSVVPPSSDTHVQGVAHVEPSTSLPTAAIQQSPPVPSPTAPEPAAIGGETPIYVLVRAPAVASRDESFQARVYVSAPAGMHQLRFSIAYDRRALELIDVSAGDFAQRSGIAADFASDEPSDGNVEVTFTLRDGRALAGTGSVAVLQFQPRTGGATSIQVSELTAYDTTGATRFRAEAPQSVDVAIE